MPTEPYNPAAPLVILTTDSYRCVLRPTDGAWREGVVDVESGTHDAMQQPTWYHKCSVSLSGHTRQSDELDVLQEILRARVKELGITVRA
jgi:hypothetical protein